MWDKIRLSEIRRDALKSLKEDFNGRKQKDEALVVLYYYVSPIFFSLLLVTFGSTVDTNIANYFITGISIFAGLFFNLLLIVADKLNERKRLLSNSKNEEDINYLKRYRYFSEHLISQLSYSIIISIVLIGLLFLTHFSSWLKNVEFIELNIFIIYYTKIIDILIFYIGIKFIVMLFIILSSMYVMLLDDIKIKEK